MLLETAHCWCRNYSLLLLLLTTHWRICLCPLATFVDVVETFSLTTTFNFNIIFSPSSTERRDNHHHFISELPPFRCRRVSPSSLYWKSCLRVRLNLLITHRQLFDCRWPLPRINPCIIDLHSGWLISLATSFWWMIFLATMVRRMEIKTLIFHMTSSLTM